MLINKNKINTYKRIIYLLIIVFLIIIVALIYLLFPKKQIYKIESRVTKLEKEKNNDNNPNYKTIGWLRVQGTNIDTPIITYLTDNDDILADKENYLWNLNGKEKIYNKVDILGHNILNLSAHPKSNLDYFSRFDDLMSFVYYDFVKDNKYIEYTIDGKDYMYKVFYVGFDYLYNIDLNKKGNYQKKRLEKYVKRLQKNSLYNFDTDVNGNDKIITLITCTRMFGTDDTREFVVGARMVRKNEKLTNYKVQKTKKYKKIEKILKGDEEDEKM